MVTNLIIIPLVFALLGACGIFLMKKKQFTLLLPNLIFARDLFIKFSNYLLIILIIGFEFLFLMLNYEPNIDVWTLLNLYKRIVIWFGGITLLSFLLYGRINKLTAVIGLWLFFQQIIFFMLSMHNILGTNLLWWSIYQYTVDIIALIIALKIKLDTNLVSKSWLNL
jgi:hypothetical protein